MSSSARSASVNFADAARLEDAPARPTAIEVAAAFAFVAELCRRSWERQR